MPTLDFTSDELRYLAKLNGQTVSVMKTIRQKGQPMPDLAVAQQIQAKLAALLPEGLPDPWADHHSERQQEPSRRSSRKKR